MRRFLAVASLALTVPLAACFDARVTADFTDTDEVKLDAFITMGPEIYQMISSVGEDPCEDGEGVENADGSFTCAMVDRRSLDELLAAKEDPENEFGLGEGVTIDQLDDGNLRVAFDISEMTSDLPPPSERAQMAAMFGDSFEGRAMVLNVVGEEIVETNGVISADGTTATLTIPMDILFAPTQPDLPASFETVLTPGN